MKFSFYIFNFIIGILYDSSILVIIYNKVIFINEVVFWNKYLIIIMCKYVYILYYLIILL